MGELGGAVVKLPDISPHQVLKNKILSMYLKKPENSRICLWIQTPSHHGSQTGILPGEGKEYTFS